MGGGGGGGGGFVIVLFARKTDWTCMSARSNHNYLVSSFPSQV